MYYIYYKTTRVRFLNSECGIRNELRWREKCRVGSWPDRRVTTIWRNGQDRSLHVNYCSEWGIRDVEWASRGVKIYEQSWWVEWVKRIRTRFWDSLFHSYFVKILANPLGLAAFLPHLSEKSFIAKFFDLKRMRFRGILVAFDCRQAVAFQRQIGQKYRNIAV